MTKNMRITDLKNIISDLPDDMLVIIPVVDEDNVNDILGFRIARTAGVLTCSGEKDREAFCINGAEPTRTYDIADQVYSSGKDVGVERVLFGDSIHDHDLSEMKWSDLLQGWRDNDYDLNNFKNMFKSVDRLKPLVCEMTIAEIEKKLGYHIKIVSDKKEKLNND